MSVVHIGGFDPGMSGGAALIACEGGSPPRIVRTLRFRAIQSAGKARILDSRALAEWLVTEPLIDIAVIEQVAAMPLQGVSSSFKFGAAAGAVDALVLALRIPTVEWVRPARWKKAMGLSSDKLAALDKAGLLFGEAAAKEHWPVLAADGCAEAALVALWYWRHQLNRFQLTQERT